MASPEEERILVAVLRQNNDRQLKASELAELAALRTTTLTRGQLVSAIWNLVHDKKLVWTKDYYIKLPDKEARTA